MYEDIMRSLDKNCNGYIDYSEFLVAASDKNKLVSSESLRMAFDLMDRDGNGSIDRAELKDVFDQEDTKVESVWNKIFADVDTDKDGKISYDEFHENM